ncbi:ABC transporter ATP-binding protein [Enterobacter cloacae complex sp. P6RS]|uniref:ABC transporter ATP-binding protein n=1 Tax=Enterobacter cloacae complex sp. P6RS TaxID=2779588 RepID=UPI001D0BEBE1|nr:ABC transporter ATP-binding protein [Enterobacter cloacae complex sp. P6RS]
MAGNTLRAALSFRNKQHAYSKESVTSLHDINIRINQGEAVGILGRNGAGKSTLLKLLTRVSRPSKGRIYVDGKISSLLEVGAGFHHDLNGRENIYLAGTILGMSRKDIRKRYDEIVHFSGVEHVLEQPVRSYSSGMFLRLAFSVGIHLPSDILVIDEAFAVGDRDFQVQCFEKITSFNQSGGSLILVSHDESQLRKVCQRGLLLEYGRLKYDGEINAAIDCYLS